MRVETQVEERIVCWERFRRWGNDGLLFLLRGWLLFLELFKFVIVKEILGFLAITFNAAVSHSALNAALTRS